MSRLLPSLPRNHLLSLIGPKNITSCLYSRSRMLQTQGACLVILLLFSFVTISRSTMSNEDLVSVDYEIFGRVQGVFFRKYTQTEGRKLGLVGWVRNTGAGTVEGQLQGPRSKVKEMQEWLRSTGSPKSHIAKAEFNNEKTIESLTHSTFNVVK